jgi:RNA polymerase sigma-70 factor (ECF subfamily)
MATQVVTRTLPVALKTESAPCTTTSNLIQVGGQLGLVLTLDGVTLCVVPLGARDEHELLPAIEA